jgi:mevalonate kinase
MVIVLLESFTTELGLTSSTVSAKAGEGSSAAIITAIKLANVNRFLNRDI